MQESQIQSRTVMSWGSRKKNEGIFYTVYFAWKGIFLRFVFYFDV